MVEDPESDWGFFSSEEISVTENFLDSGYIIIDVDDTNVLERIRNKLAVLAADRLGQEVSNEQEFLNRFHEFIDPHDLNETRVHLIQKINEGRWLKEQYFNVARSALERLVGNELAMQRQVNLSIQMPGDASSLLPVHADVWSGDSPFEVVVWLPLVDCFGTKSMFLLPPEQTKNLHDNFSKFSDKSSEYLFNAIHDDLIWLEIPYGKVLLFNQNLPHGNRINEETETRWSMNCRFKSVFSPYGDKKIGEFFVPITLRAASRIGMSYRLPGET